MRKVKKTNYTLLNCLFLAGFLIIIIVYLIQVNTTVSYSLDMKRNNQQLEALQIQNEHLVKAVTEISSVGNIYASSHSLNLVEAKDIAYIELSEETLAER
ncbi:hypothetical protein MYX07_06425 [Patescibacteria group bacterium AH-259-L07]|nr:hypothetical protein [Patescibacteria group bacterium AH-259-L07]